MNARKICDEACEALTLYTEDSCTMSANSLEAVAKGRYVLTMVADCIYNCFIEKDSSYKDLDAKRELMSLLESARRLCSSSTPQLYLVKQLVRSYGYNCVRTLSKNRKLIWILPLEARRRVRTCLLQ